MNQDSANFPLKEKVHKHSISGTQDIKRVQSWETVLPEAETTGEGAQYISANKGADGVRGKISPWNLS